jgi:exodeoxyribonuclease V alpha subunit
VISCWPTGAPEDWLRCCSLRGGERRRRPTPMILCGDRLYLNRMWRNELTVARFFNEANQVLEVDEARLANAGRAVSASDETTGKKWPRRWR